jgi:hypothetical protein
MQKRWHSQGQRERRGQLKESPRALSMKTADQVTREKLREQEVSEEI